ncbi:two-component response regulator [Vibrio orientalis CIP 102891 = ATCC 33934]|nr:response regulator transcription factor [Vibrio orientalis]EGU53755.1 two-component response regulator [Vibrio orientalis CIP 102891 = ATCC 33934]
MKKFNILVFDDHPLVGVAIKATLSLMSCVDSISSVYSFRSALDVIKNKNINFVILDINLSDGDGYDFYRRIKSHGYQGKVLFYSAEESSLYSKLAFKSGADGYVCKSEHQEILRDAVEGISNGYTFFKFKSDKSGYENEEQVTLSNREAMVMSHLLNGKTNKDIGQLLKISDKTVSTYKKRLFDKYSVNNLVELIKVVNV